MGNCCGILSNKIQRHGPSPIPQDTELVPYVFPTNTIETASTTQSSTPFVVTPDPMGLGIGSSSPSMPTATTIEFLDQRLLSLLEFFKQLHFRRRDIFKQILPVHRKDFEDIFDKMEVMGQEENQQHKLGGLLQKSRSSDDLKMDRFKVKPIDSPNDNIKGGGSKPPKSK